MHGQQDYIEMHGQQDYTEMHGQQDYTEMHGQKNINIIRRRCSPHECHPKPRSTYIKTACSQGNSNQNV